MQWSKGTQEQVPNVLAENTCLTYIKMLEKFHKFCLENGHSFPPTSTSALAEFLSTLGDSTDTPPASPPSNPRIPNPDAVSLKRTFAASIGSDLESDIEMAGLQGPSLSAKRFRPIEATTSSKQGCKTVSVRRIGRWTCRDSYEERVICPNARKVLTDDVMDQV